MKTPKLLLITLCILISCADNDFSIPKDTNKEENETLQAVLDSIKSGHITLLPITSLKKDFFTSREPRKITGNYVVKGYVTSSDASGNFYKEFYIQDAPENPTAGIKILLNKNNSHAVFNLGREVHIRLKGLYIGESRRGDNNPAIGGFVKKESPELEPISNRQLTQQHQILRSTTTETLIPLPVKTTQINEAHLGLFVVLENVHFSAAELGTSYVDPTRDFDTERTLQTCNLFKYDEIQLETSSFANFGSILLPRGSGNIAAVVVKDYDRNIRLALNSPKDVHMNDTRCALETVEGYTTIFKEEFSSKKLTNWTLKNTKGIAGWKINKSTRNNPTSPCVEINSSGQGENENWLVSKVIDLSNNTKAILSFENTIRTDKGGKLAVLIRDASEDSWTTLYYNRDFNTKDYNARSSGYIDISAFAGKQVFITFKYSCTAEESTLYRIDNIIVLGK